MWMGVFEGKGVGVGEVREDEEMEFGGEGEEVWWFAGIEFEGDGFGAVWGRDMRDLGLGYLHV